EKNISFIEADLTKKNDDLMKFMNEHGRIGIPFLMVYGPAAPSGILLSEMPTVSELITAIEEAASPKHSGKLRFNEHDAQETGK
ncbi:MAG: hypothetical protein LBB29_03005, partial [Holosporaceae bacterium]|nr:hypothetical protein [Holosporaceae bacterium]